MALSSGDFVIHASSTSALLGLRGAVTIGPDEVSLEDITGDRQGSRRPRTLAHVTGAQLTYANGLEAVRMIRPDRKLEGVDPGIARATGQITARFADTVLLGRAGSGTPIDLAFGYAIDTNRSLTITLHEVYLSGGKTPITGPAGVEATLDFRAAFNATAGSIMTMELRNQQAGSEYA